MSNFDSGADSTPRSKPGAICGTLEGLLTNPDFAINMDCLIDCANVILSLESCKEASNFSDRLRKLQSDLQHLNALRIRVEDFIFLKQIGKGAFGDVHLVRYKRNNAVYALKTLRKVEMVKRSDSAFFWEERHIMTTAESDWIVKLHYAFQDSKNLYMVMDYVPGGDLVNLLAREDICEKDAKFYCAEVVLAIEAVHELGYIHRDIKPDNVLIDARGHLKLTDFGTCIRVDPDGLVRSDTAVGTPDYICPEILKSQGKIGVYGKEIDWWSLGVFLYEMLVGETPFYAESLVGTYGKIMDHKESLTFPFDMDVSDNAKQFIRALLSERETRLGINGADEVKSHPFFQDVEWTWANIRQTDAPSIPVLSGPEDTRYFDEIDESRICHKEDDGLAIRPRQYDHLKFIGFTYSNDMMPFKQSSDWRRTDADCQTSRDALNLVLPKKVISYANSGDGVSCIDEQTGSDYYKFSLQTLLTMEQELKNSSKKFEQVMQNLENEMVLKLQLESALYQLKRESEREKGRSETASAEIQKLKDMLTQYEDEKTCLAEKYDKICEKQTKRIAELEAETRQFREQIEKVLVRNSVYPPGRINQDDAAWQTTSNPCPVETVPAERAGETSSLHPRRCVQLTNSSGRAGPSRPLACCLRCSGDTMADSDGGPQNDNADFRWSFESDLNQLYRSHLRELTLDATELAGHCETIQDDLDNALGRINELNECVKQLKRARIQDETQRACLRNQLDRSELRNRQLESDLSEANSRYQHLKKELAQKEADLRCMKEVKGRLVSSLERMTSCHREIERKYSEVSQECARRGLQIAQAENDLVALRREYQEQRVMKMEAVKKLENLLQNPMEIPYISKITKTAGRRDHRMEKQCKILEQILGNERMNWSREEGRLQDEINRKDEEIKLLGEELTHLREKMSVQTCEANKLVEQLVTSSDQPAYSAPRSSIQHRTNQIGSRYSAYSPVHVIPLQSSLSVGSEHSAAESPSDKPFEGGPDDVPTLRQSGETQNLHRFSSIFNSASVIDKCEDRLEGWLQIPSKHNIKRNGWRRHFVVAKSGRVSFYESDKDSLPWFVIPADKLFHVRSVTIHDVMRVDASLLPRIFQILYDASIAPSRLLTGGQQHSVMKSDVINHNGHSFMVVGYRKSTVCDYCEKPCNHLITPPAAVECTRCHFKCHKCHIDSDDNTIPKCRVQEEAKASSLLILCSSEQEQRRWMAFLSGQAEAR